MRIATVRQLGAVVRGRRLELGETQAACAHAIGASRAWVNKVEAGRESSDLALVLRLLEHLDLVLDARAAEAVLDDRPRRLDLDGYLSQFTDPT